MVETDETAMRIVVLPYRDMAADVVVLANGEFPASGVAAELLAVAERVVCCDGAADKLLSYGREPTVIIGDGDSTNAATSRYYNSLFVKVAEQDTNDLCKALDYCIEKGWSDIVVLGASGLREDHALANLGVMIKYSDVCRLSMVTMHGVFNVACGHDVFESWQGQQVSLFTFDPRVNVSIEGLLYVPAEGRLDGLWHGISNESVGNEFVIDSDGPVLVYRVFEKKVISSSLE